MSLLVAASAFYGLAAHAQLEEVLVTAQKRTQSLQDVPMAVSAMSGEMMQKNGIETVADLSLHMPTLEVNTTTSPVSNIYRIRRLGNLANVPSVEPAVAIMVDGAFRGRPIFGAGDLFDVERIEVLRGPQSTLYGKNATAGVIAIHTAAPAEEFEWKAEMTAGKMDAGEDPSLFRFKGGISGPLTDTLRGSLGVSALNQDELMSDGLVARNGVSTNENERLAIRGQLAWDATDKLSMRGIFGNVEMDNIAGTGNDIFFDQSSILFQGIPGVLPPVLETAAALAVGETGQCGDNDPANYKGCHLQDVRTDVTAREFTLLIDYGFDNGWSLNSTTSWDWYEFSGAQNDVAQVSSSVLRYNPQQESESIQQELRLSSAGGEVLDWQVGAFYYKNKFFFGDKGKSPMFMSDVDSGNPLWEAILGIPWATPGQNGFLDGRQESEYIALFGQGTWNATDNFSVTAGLRWQEEDKDMSIDQAATGGVSVISALLSPVALGWTGGEDSRSASEVTWSISPQYNISDDSMVYATASHGFKSGGFDIGFGAAPADGREFEDEELMHYELGIKSELLDGNMRLAASVFYTDIENYQDPLFVGGQFVIRNAKSTELKGVELEGTALLSDRLTADFAISYVELEYDEYTEGGCFGQIPVGGVPNGTNGGCDLSGQTPGNAPRTKANLGLTWEDDVSWGTYYLGGNVAYTDDYKTTQSAHPDLEQDDYFWLTLRAGARWDRYEVVAWMDNATNEEVVTFAAPLSLVDSLGDQSFQTFLLAPRSYGLTFRVNY
ncbi:TonB-dependent receptor [gamma proteobacterium NOR5-3]|nr:TonB-dependent receptor [gamma proteobacterium NOR5-3]